MKILRISPDQIQVHKIKESTIHISIDMSRTKYIRGKTSKKQHVVLEILIFAHKNSSLQPPIYSWSLSNLYPKDTTTTFPHSILSILNRSGHPTFAKRIYTRLESKPFSPKLPYLIQNSQSGQDRNQNEIPTFASKG